MYILSWDEILRMYAIAPTVIGGVYFGYWLATRKTSKDIVDMKESLKIMEKHDA